MRKNLFLNGIISASLLFSFNASNAQEAERLPVMAEGVNATQAKAGQATMRSQAQKVMQVGSANKNEAALAAGTNILVNNNDGATGIGRFTQSETSTIAFGNFVVTSYNDAGSIATAGGHFTGWSYSSDGGASFTDGGTLPTSAFGDAGDPVLARNNTTGRIYLLTLGFNNGNVIPVFHSDDNGVTWSAPVNGTPGGSSEDKPWVAVDNFAGSGNGNVYLLSRRFGAGPGIYFFRSTDNGATFGPNGGTLIVAESQGAYIEVGPDHSIYAFWRAGTSVQMRRSTDQGATFGPVVNVATLVLGGSNGDLGLTGIRQGVGQVALPFRTSKFPHAAVNPVNGNLYVTYANDPAGADKADVFYVQSTNNGATWSAPVRINDDATTTDQWQPTVAISPDGQHIGFFYYSRQEDAANNLFKYYGRTGTVSGATVTLNPSAAVSTVASLPEFGRDNQVNSTYMGDYNTVSATNTDFHIVWSDNRDNLTGGGDRKDPNVYYSKLSIAVVDNEPPVITCPADITTGNDAGLCSRVIAVGMATATATDNSGTVTITGVRSDAQALTAPYPVGTTTILWTATDPSNNSASCTQTIIINDTELPNALCKNVSVTLVNGSATITAADVNNGSTDNCGIQSVSVSKTSFGCADIGANTVTLTVTDIHNNINTCTATVTVVGEVPSCTITAIPSNNTYTGGIPTNIYLGYGPQSVTLSSTATGGAPFTYSWSPSTGLSSTTSAAPVFTPTAEGTYVFTLTVTNTYGCTSTCTITICVLDIRVPGTNGKKVYVCHIPQGNTGNPQTLSLSVNAVSTHIFSPGHGDHLGTCDQVPCAAPAMITKAPIRLVNVTEGNAQALKVSALPNPSTGAFTVQIESSQKELVSVRVVDLFGRTVLQTKVAANTTFRLGDNLVSGTYIIEVAQGNKISKFKLLKMQ